MKKDDKPFSPQRERRNKRLAAIWAEKEHVLECELTLEDDYARYLHEQTRTNQNFIYPEEEAHYESIKRCLDKELKRLPEREELFIRLYFGLMQDKEALFYDEIADLVGISRARVNQIVWKALRRLKKNMRRMKDIF